MGVTEGGVASYEAARFHFTRDVERVLQRFVELGRRLELTHDLGKDNAEHKRGGDLATPRTQRGRLGQRRVHWTKLDQVVLLRVALETAFEQR